MISKGQPLPDVFASLNIAYTEYVHPPAPDIPTAKLYWKDIEAAHCKNLFFRNHKGNRHYLVIVEHTNDLAIHDLEKRLKQGKLTFASEGRMHRYLGVKPGSVTPFGLINDIENHVHLFIDENLRHVDRISFHPLVNTASWVIRHDDFERFLSWTGNTWEYIALY
ncbi:MAG TPA: prolyl-tRNA editing protein [Bacteroidales bacterium]|nr:MAG: prolyl-tRNA editing protein [Bacteroidetes bacterium GWE2_42_24]OFY31556.1 MAG: prolyl-tRNA editing protein [Bacteroidetes bacterium GWF2_43_11]HAQ65730.1 prolyl-tRNA editing protein [Bacteroidales bacterium]HBZ67194.1 prolyl-tRNA editing protein [Bacteroidales bacterium]